MILFYFFDLCTFGYYFENYNRRIRSLISKSVNMAEIVSRLLTRIIDHDFYEYFTICMV